MFKWSLFMKRNVNLLKSVYTRHKKEYKKVYKAINQYERIVVFRHLLPDFDALGSQMGIVTWLKDHYPNKEIRFVGDDHVSFTPRLYPKMEKLDDDWFEHPFLALILDTGNSERIADGRWQRASFSVKIDHHPSDEDYADVNIVDTTTAAASELIVNMLLFHPKKKAISKQSSAYFFTGLAGDSGRFMYSSTSRHTFAVATFLLESGINLSEDVYLKMYQKSIDDLKVTAYVLNNFTVSPHGVAYYLLSSKIQEELSITVERGKENVNLFSNIEGVNAWCSISEDPKDGVWRISIRSKAKPINQIAKRFGGGGHPQASGAKIDKLEELSTFISALDELFK
jgi:bifunctional oligoribonuclease and PAP phosphatase NrnA